jgi:hypothetical protein
MNSRESFIFYLFSIIKEEKLIDGISYDMHILMIEFNASKTKKRDLFDQCYKIN